MSGLRPSPGQKKTPPLAPPGGALAQRRQLLFVRLALQRQAALLARGAAEEVAVALGEVRGRDEAAGQRPVDHRHVGLQQQQAGLVEQQLEIVARRRAVQVIAEQGLDRQSTRLNSSYK